MTAPELTTLADAFREFDLGARLCGDAGTETVSVYRGATSLPQLDLEALGPCLVTGDLDVAGDILGMGEESGFLIVLGTCHARNLLIGGPEVWIERDLIVENGVLADYNHGLLTVGGDLTATVVCAEHTVRVNDAAFSPTVSRDEAVHQAKTRFVPEVLNAQGCVTGRLLMQRMLSGASVLLAD